MARIEEIRARVADIAQVWPNDEQDQVRGYLDELNGYLEEVGTSSHPDAGELIAQIYQLIENITEIAGAPDA
jgi:hypothetical protein